jgi:folate-dependent phosphoribosylglycinamide formyltransferase PurN
MRLGVLTTDTPHHRYFLREVTRRLSSDVEVVLNLFEDRPYPWRRRAARHFRLSLPNLWRATILNPYVQSRRFAARQLSWEETAFFPTGDRSLPPSVPTHVVRSVNDSEAERLLRQARPDLLFVYGTGLIKSHVFDMPTLGAVNAHGGLLPGYRGLDTNLWAAFEGHPEDMAVTLHRVDADYDTGPTYMQHRLGRITGLNLLTLRFHTTVMVTDMAVDLLHRIAAGSAATLHQSGTSRYYGPMPLWLRHRADRVIRDYAAGFSEAIAA